MIKNSVFLQDWAEPSGQIIKTMSLNKVLADLSDYKSSSAVQYLLHL